VRRPKKGTKSFHSSKKTVSLKNPPKEIAFLNFNKKNKHKMGTKREQFEQIVETKKIFHFF